MKVIDIFRCKRAERICSKHTYTKINVKKIFFRLKIPDGNLNIQEGRKK